MVEAEDEDLKCEFFDAVHKVSSSNEYFETESFEGNEDFSTNSQSDSIDDETTEPSCGSSFRTSLRQRASVRFRPREASGLKDKNLNGENLLRSTTIKLDDSTGVISNEEIQKRLYDLKDGEKYVDCSGSMDLGFHSIGSARTTSSDLEKHEASSVSIIEDDLNHEIEISSGNNVADKRKHENPSILSSNTVENERNHENSVNHVENDMNSEDSCISSVNCDDSNRNSVNCEPLSANRQKNQLNTDNPSSLSDGAVSSVKSNIPLLPEDTSSNFMVSIAEFSMKAIGLQIAFLIGFLKVSFLFFQYSLMAITDPLGTILRAKEHAKNGASQIPILLYEKAKENLPEWIKDKESVGKLAVKFSWGCFWSLCLCFLLICSLILAFILGGVILKNVLEVPIRMEEKLNFDYTQEKPVAFMPIIHCNSWFHSNNGDKIDNGRHTRLRVIPENQKLQIILALTLPESDYNQRIGVFQVRVELLFSNGNINGGSSYPTMLHFKSTSIRLLETFLKAIPIISGYTSESQTIKLRMRGFIERSDPTSCLRVTLEPRAEYKPGHGIPEVYAASLVLESELSLFKRLMWSWRMTICIWLSSGVLVIELLLVLILCKPIIFRQHPANYGSHSTNRA